MVVGEILPSSKEVPKTMHLDSVGNVAAELMEGGSQDADFPAPILEASG
jgi:hypothetical protein